MTEPEAKKVPRLTRYVVLKEVEESIWHEAGRGDAPNGDAAIKQALETHGDEGTPHVAVPERSFQPKTPKQKTTTSWTLS